jgi:ketosteroid isomerase-like protein
MPRSTATAFVMIVASLALAIPAWSGVPRLATPGGPPSANVVPGPRLLQQVVDAWNTGDPAKAAPFYDPSAINTFYDESAKRIGWTAVAAAAREELSRFRSIRYSVGDDAAVHASTGVAWGTATLHRDAVERNGRHRSTSLRWTVIWELRLGRWVITHEHRSAPVTH